MAELREFESIRQGTMPLVSVTETRITRPTGFKSKRLAPVFVDRNKFLVGLVQLSGCRFVASAGLVQ